MVLFIVRKFRQSLCYWRIGEDIYGDGTQRVNVPVGTCHRRWEGGRPGWLVVQSLTSGHLGRTAGWDVTDGTSVVSRHNAGQHSVSHVSPAGDKPLDRRFRPTYLWYIRKTLVDLEMTCLPYVRPIRAKHYTAICLSKEHKIPARLNLVLLNHWRTWSVWQHT